MQLEWSPGIGDPHLMGWVITVCYLACAAHGLVVVRRARRVFAEPVRRQKLLWLGLALLMLCLGLNKQLDLQSLLIEVARILAQREGWYEARRTAQTLFVGAMAALTLVCVVALLASLRRVLRSHWVALLGVSTLAVFVLVRAATVHRVETVFESPFGQVPVHSVPELAGVLLVWWNAWTLGRKSRSQPGQ